MRKENDTGQECKASRKGECSFLGRWLRCVGGANSTIFLVSASSSSSSFSNTQNTPKKWGGDLLHHSLDD